MGSFGAFILTALSLVFVIEGLIYALFPGAVRRMMAAALTLPPATLRKIGLCMAVTGACLAWLLSRF
jgi:uncharacterized protein YjeT (DUF2065 family)